MAHIRITSNEYEELTSIYTEVHMPSVICPTCKKKRYHFVQYLNNTFQCIDCHNKMRQNIKDMAKDLDNVWWDDSQDNDDEFWKR